METTKNLEHCVHPFKTIHSMPPRLLPVLTASTQLPARYGRRHPTGSLAVHVIAGNTNFGTAPFFSLPLLLPGDHDVPLCVSLLLVGVVGHPVLTPDSTPLATDCAQTHHHRSQPAPTCSKKFSKQLGRESSFQVKTFRCIQVEPGTVTQRIIGCRSLTACWRFGWICER